MSSTATDVGEFGRHIPSPSSTMRPPAGVELARWGGTRLVRGKRVLDVGCGDGRLALGVAGSAREVDGVDPDADMIAAAKQRARQVGVANARFKRGDARRLPYASGSFEVAILSWTL